jgi:tRNA threonylcarbamoyladenosine biosynthesis protein TsaB
MSQLLLAVDTSGKNGSVALARVTPGQSEIVVLEVVPLTGGAFSAQLVPQIGALLGKHGYSKNDMGAFAVANGPGSFTGLRVGLAAIQGLAEALRKPVVAISLLEAIACSGPERGRVLAVLDAGRGDLYAGDYEIEGEDGGQVSNVAAMGVPAASVPARRVAGRAQMRSEHLLSRDGFLAEASLQAGGLTAVITPDSALAEAFRASLGNLGLRVVESEYPNSAVIARIGWERLERGQAVRPEELEANYIRQSDAEIFAKPRL